MGVWQTSPNIQEIILKDLESFLLTMRKLGEELKANIARDMISYLEHLCKSNKNAEEFIKLVTIWGTRSTTCKRGK